MCWGPRGNPALTGHCQVRLLPLLPPWGEQAESSLPHTHSHWPSGDLGPPALSRATLPPWSEVGHLCHPQVAMLASGSIPGLPGHLC